MLNKPGVHAWHHFYDALKSTSLNVPALEVAVLLIVLTFCLLFRAPRVGLLVAFLFAYRLGWMFMQASYAKSQQIFIVGYLVFGIVSAILFLYTMWFRSEE